MKNICSIVFIGMLLWCGPIPRAACAEESAASAAARVIQAEEVEDEASAVEQSVSLAQVEKSRAVTGDRLYSLAGLWLLIVLVIFLIRFQVRDDEKLYDQGYYEKDLDHM